MSLVFSSSGCAAMYNTDPSTFNFRRARYISEEVQLFTGCALSDEGVNTKIEQVQTNTQYVKKESSFFLIHPVYLANIKYVANQLPPSVHFIAFNKFL